MCNHINWKIIFLHIPSSSVGSLGRHTDNLGKESRRFSILAVHNSNRGSSWSTLHFLCVSPIIQIQTILFAVVLYPWLILRVMHAGMDIILWTPANWSWTINGSSKMILLPLTVGFALQCWVQRTMIAGQMSTVAQRTVNRNNNKDKADGNK